MSFAILKCGSKARGDTNIHSDEDYVCIHTKENTSKKKIKKKYQNISFIQTDSISRMKNKGSLFITHLDVDGILIDGDSSLLGSIHSFTPNKESLELSINSTSNFIKSIEWYPPSTEGKLWLMDVLYVSLRNILYCANALTKNYKFGLQDAMSLYGLTDREVETMLEIRQGKYAFRSSSVRQQYTEILDLKLVESLVSRLINTKVIFESGGKTNWSREWNYDYWDERLIEKAIINNEVKDNGFREKLLDHNYNKRCIPDIIKKYISTAQDKII